jgi:hypothetical protein
MSEYYFIGTYIPELQIGTSPEISIDAYASLLEENLSTVDKSKWTALRRYYDLMDLLFFWMGRPLTGYGNFNENTLEEAILTGKDLPEYIDHYLDAYESTADRIQNFSKLYASYYGEEIPKAEGFLKSFLIEDQAIRLILVGLRSKKWGRPLLAELQFEDPNEDLVAYMLAQKDAKTFEPPVEYAELKSLFESFSEEPLKLQRAILSYRFQKVGELIGLQTFTLDRLLSYYVQLVLADQWKNINTIA